MFRDLRDATVFPYTTLFRSQMRKRVYVDAVLERGHGGRYRPRADLQQVRSEEHTSELQSHSDLVCRLLHENKTFQLSGVFISVQRKFNRRFTSAVEFVVLTQ